MALVVRSLYNYYNWLFHDYQGIVLRVNVAWCRYFYSKQLLMISGVFYAIFVITSTLLQSGSYPDSFS